MEKRFGVVSADGHCRVMHLPFDLWTKRLPSKLRDDGTGKTHVALGLGLAACHKGLAVGFITAATLVHELMEARDERRLLRLQKQLVGHKLLIIDELVSCPSAKPAPSCCSS